MVRLEDAGDGVADPLGGPEPAPLGKLPGQVPARQLHGAAPAVDPGVPRPVARGVRRGLGLGPDVSGDGARAQGRDADAEQADLAAEALGEPFEAELGGGVGSLR